MTNDFFLELSEDVYVKKIIDEYILNVDNIGLPGENTKESYKTFIKNVLKNYTEFIISKHLPTHKLRKYSV